MQRRMEPMPMEPMLMEDLEDPPTTRRRPFSFKDLIPKPTRPVVKKLLSWRQSDEEEAWAKKAIASLVTRLSDRSGAIEELKHALSCPGAPSKCVTIPRSLDGRLQVLHRKQLPHVIYCRVWRWPDLQSHHELQSLAECKFAFSKKLREVCVNPYHYNRVPALVLPPVMVPKHTDFIPGNSFLPFQQLTEPFTPRTVTYTEEGFTGIDMNAARIPSSALEPQSPNLIELQPRAHNSAYNNLMEELNINDYQELKPTPQPMELQPPPQPVNYEEQNYWASIAYYELNRRVGEIFNCKKSSIIVDGFTNPDGKGERFCVGQLSSMHRNSSIENVRKHIGNGIHLQYFNGEVYVDCLSNSSIFVQSKVANHINGFYPSTVCKISPGNSLKVFDSSEFSKLLGDCVNCSYESVYQLTEMCTIRIAFVKGWGAQYNRSDITSTPSWIEIHCHGPLKWLDKVLIEMGGPTDQISSVS